MAFAGRALRERRLAAAMLAGPTDGDAAAERLAFRRALAEELAARIRAAIEAGHLPDQDATFAAAAVIGAVVEGLVGELSGAAETRGGAARRRPGAHPVRPAGARRRRRPRPWARGAGG